jgi:hypothetical protein
MATHKSFDVTYQGDIVKIKLKHALIYIEDFTPGKGKIIVETNYGTYSSYWGAMGSCLSEFIKRINSDYFAKNLVNNMYVFCPKESVKELRGYIRNNSGLSWYQFTDQQKEMRLCIKDLEKASSEHEFVDICYRIPDSISTHELSVIDQEFFEEHMNNIFKNEPWHFISSKPSNEFLLMQKVHNELKTALK